MTKWNHNRQRVLGVLFGVAMLVAVAGFESGPASAGPNIWTRTGPTALNGLVARDNVGGMYAVAAGSIEATYNGLPATTVYKSTDTGATWAAVGDFGMATEGAYPSPFYLAVSPDGRVLMLNVLVNNRLPLLKSSDGGATWRQVVGQFETNNLVIDPTDSNRMYANGKGGFYRSTNGGSTWERMSTTSPAANAYLLVGQIAINPARPSNLLAVTDEGVRGSNDYGATWQTVAPPPARDATLEQQTVPGSPAGSRSILAFVPRPGGDSLVVSAEGSGIYASRDGGQSWTRGNYAGKMLHGPVLGFDAVAGRMYLALFRREGEIDGEPYRQLPLTLFTSTDGDTWTEVGPLPLRKPVGFSFESGAIQANPAAPGRLFRSDGLFSGDDGKTWSGPGRGLPLADLPVQSFITAVNDWYAGSGITVYRSSDKGASWTQLAPQAEIDNQPLESLFGEITGLGAHENVLLAYLFPHLVTGGPGGHYVRPATVIRSTDGGASWQPTGLSINGREARFTFDGSTGTVYLAAAPIVRTLGSHFTTRGDGGLYKSTDGGATWTQLPLNMPVNNVIVDPTDRSHLLAAGYTGLAESTNGGATWRPILTNPQVGGLVFNQAGSFARLYAYGAEGLDDERGILRGGLYTSIDGGRSWNAIKMGDLSPQQYRVVSYDLGATGHLLVAWTPGQGGGLRVSDSVDGGTSWRELTGLGLQPNLESVYIDPMAGPAGRVLARGQWLYSYRTVIVEPDPAFRRVWLRQDEPVSAKVAQRSWTWGETPFATMREGLEGLPGNVRTVQYWDKSRMEVNDPGADRNSPWFVTNGLLTVEMVAGRVQIGLDKWLPHAPSLVPVAGDGDPGANPNAPTYASFRGVASYENGNNQAQNLVGRGVSQSIDAQGKVTAIVPPGTNVRLAAYDAQSGHNIAAPFWEFLNRPGLVATAPGQYTDGPIFSDWVFVMGHPISEPYWTNVRVSGQDRVVLVQLFERRVLTYTPTNEPTWQVEMGNVGLHYYVWRYGGER